jgi:hypothetical protein
MKPESIARLCNDNRSVMYNSKSPSTLYDNTDFFFDENFYDRHFISGPDAIEESMKAIDKLLKITDITDNNELGQYLK